MDNRKWLASADAAPPPVPAVPSTGFPRDTNPPTVPGAWWYHAIGEELRSVIAAAGLTPDINNVAQLRDAIVVLASATSSPIRLTAQTFAAGVVNGSAVLWDAANNRWSRALADGTSNDLVAAFADVTNLRVYLAGLAPALFAGLTPGARYYLDPTTPGAITTIRPADAIYVGIAKSATDLYVDCDPASAATFVASFNGRTGGVNLTSADVTGALGYTPMGRLISVANAAASSSIVFDLSAYVGAHDLFEFRFDKITPSTDLVNFVMEVSDDAGVSWKTTGYDSQQASGRTNGAGNTTITTNYPLADGGLDGRQLNDATYGGVGSLLLAPNGATKRKPIISNYMGPGSSVYGTPMHSFNAGYWGGGVTPITAVRFRFSSGNVESGSIHCFGLRKN